VNTGDLRYCIEQSNMRGQNNTIDARGIQGTITLGSALDPITRPVVITGPANAVLTVRRDPNAGQNFRVFQVQTTGTVQIQFLTISGGTGDAGSHGGGILLSGGTLNVLDCTISNNQAAYGGGISVDQGTLAVNRGSITGNRADSQGGGLYAGPQAGAVSIEGGLTAQTAYQVNNNRAGSAGGGIYFINPAGGTGSLAITFTNITLNQVTGNGNGAGLFAQAPEARTGHIAPVLVTNSLFRENLIAPTATGNGGAVYTNGIARFSDCTLVRNSASHGGGVFHILAPGNLTTMNSCTVTRNTSLDRTGAALEGIPIDNPSGRASRRPPGGALGPADGIGDGLQLGNTIVAGNTAPNSPNSPDVAGTLVSLGHNLIGDGTGVTGFLPSDLVGTSSAPIDPRLSDLGDYGGPTQTCVLLAGSPALNAGDNALVDSPTDQRGYARIVNGTVDIGAVEMQPGELPGT
jgi:hypothetical protein